MSQSAAEISSSLSVISKKELSDRHFRWDSLRKFIYLATAFSSTVYNFDLFSQIFYRVSVFDFVICQVFIGMPHMFMDGFIMQYTRRIDGHKFLNPLLKGISFGQFVQSGFFALLQASYVSDAARFLFAAFGNNIPWSHCREDNSTCVSIDKILIGCRDHGQKFNLLDTAAHENYRSTFTVVERSVLTTRCFIIGLVWMLNFLVSTISDDGILKMYFFGFVFKSVSTTVVLIILFLSVQSEPREALTSIMDYNFKSVFQYALTHVMYTYGVGFVTFYDFGTVSPYTMIDTAVVLYSLVFTVMGIFTSWILRVMYLRLVYCVKVPRFLLHTHYLYFTVVPLSTEFLRAQKLYAFYIYLNLILTSSNFLTMMTLTMAKILHSEFRSVKVVYLVGVICCLGFSLSLPITVQLTSSFSKIKGYFWGLNVAVTFLGALKVAIIMWLYGVRRFSTDIQFWLGFRPTKYWKLCWSILPVILVILLVHITRRLIMTTKSHVLIIALVWIGVTLAIVLYTHFKTISKFLVRNNLASVFNANVKYGPPDPSDRSRRRHYSETMQLRRCKHSCQIIDDSFDCNHLPLVPTGGARTSSTESLTKDIYRAESVAKGPIIKNQSVADFAELQHRHY